MTEFSVTLANRPGQLAHLARILADAAVELEAFAAVADDGQSHVRFVVLSAPRARRALSAAGMEFQERDVLDTFLPRGLESLSHTAQAVSYTHLTLPTIYSV